MADYDLVESTAVQLLELNKQIGPLRHISDEATASKFEGNCFSVIYDYESKAYMLFPGWTPLGGNNYPTDSYVITARPLPVDEKPRSIIIAATLDCEACDGLGENEDREQCSECSGNGSEGDYVTFKNLILDYPENEREALLDLEDYSDLT